MEQLQISNQAVIPSVVEGSIRQQIGNSFAESEKILRLRSQMAAPLRMTGWWRVWKSAPNWSLTSRWSVSLRTSAHAGVAISKGFHSFSLGFRLFGGDCHVGLRPPRNDTVYKQLYKPKFDVLFIIDQQKRPPAKAGGRFYKSYSWGPASTRALPSSLPVYLVKFLMKRAARSLAFSSQMAASA